MSGAAGFSPTESWNVVVLAAVAVPAVGAASAPEAMVGSAIAATTAARTSPGRLRGRTTRVTVDATPSRRNC